MFPQFNLVNFKHDGKLKMRLKKKRCAGDLEMALKRRVGVSQENAVEKFWL
jgi:hypothetical protein